MRQVYCLPIIKKTKQEVIQMAYDNLKEYRYFEVWLDYIDDLNYKFIKGLKKLLQGKLILLFRRRNLETTRMPFEKRKHTVSLLEDSRSLLDLDVFVQKEELEYIKNNQLNVKTIVSYHNYKETPSVENLRRIIDIIGTYNPTIFKISTMCTDEKDGIRLLQILLELKEKKVKYVILGMGEFGTITRIFGTLWGNEMIFAPDRLTEQSATGQLTKKQLETIFRELD